jgi:hypothetical protein
MIEQRRLPFHAVVALRATRDVSLRELLPVDILMTVFALLRGSFEINIDQLGLKIWRLMTVDASRGPVCPEQGEFRLRVVESG